MPGAVEIAFYLPETDGAPSPVPVEFLWAEPVGGALYRVLSLPSFVAGVSVGDLVLVSDRGPELAFESVSEQSGHSTLRVVIGDASAAGSFLEPIAQLGCVFHETLAGANAFTIDVPANGEIVQLLDYLREAQGREVANWEVGAISRLHAQALRAVLPPGDLPDWLPASNS